ncbi:MAG: HAMP domain-containing histidine kinase [Candidatus Omnitrophica bacterium]|nr:HAMP domain-containing histidine kinase [Candidatus Omnitrophota bacterium]
MNPEPQSIDSFTLISALADRLDTPLKSVSARIKKIINEYKDRDFEYISYKDFKIIFSTLEQLEHQLAHCSQITNRMLYVGKIRSRLEKDSCQINEVIVHMADDLKQQLNFARSKLHLRLSQKLPIVALGPVECHQIIHNVIMNAIEAMPVGGVIKLKTSLNKTGDCVDIEVSDQGVGISPEHLPKVFEPFFTTKRTGPEQSAGLGLSIIYSIVDAVGGKVHIKSSLRSGTTVLISIPVLLRS